MTEKQGDNFAAIERCIRLLHQSSENHERDGSKECYECKPYRAEIALARKREAKYRAVVKAATALSNSLDYDDGKPLTRELKAALDACPKEN